MKFKSLVAAMGVAVTTLVSAQASALDKNLPEYNKTSGISGNFSSVGSDTLANMMTFVDRKSTRLELQSHSDLVCRLLLEKKKRN